MQWTAIIFRERKNLRHSKTKQMEFYLKFHFRIISCFVFLYVEKKNCTEEQFQHFNEYFIISLIQRCAWARVCTTFLLCWHLHLKFMYRLSWSFVHSFDFVHDIKSWFFFRCSKIDSTISVISLEVFAFDEIFFLRDDEDQNAIHFKLWTKKK